jgi:hypothetical protein
MSCDPVQPDVVLPKVPPQMLPKVVAIGFNKCATRSLAQLFAGAGHPVVHQKLPAAWRLARAMHGRRKLGGIMCTNLQAGCPVFAGVEQYLFYGDLIDSNRRSSFDGNRLFREILRDYPDTILLLNWRNREDWIRSRLQHGHGEFAAREQRVRKLSSLDELCDAWRDEWDAHLEAVRAFMAERPAQLVEFNIDSDPIEQLIARFPAYGLQAEHYGDIGRSRGRHLPSWLKAAKHWLAHTRPRAQC